MRIKTVGDLISELQELPEDMPIMAQYQYNWPLREVIGGIWVDDGNDPEEECEECGRVALAPVEKYDADGRDYWARKCYICKHENEVDKPEEVAAYIVLNGHPYEGTPYGSKNAWNVI